MTEDERKLLILVAQRVADKDHDREIANQIYSLIYDVEHDAYNQRIADSMTLED